MSPEDRAAAEADTANDLKKRYPTAATAMLAPAPKIEPDPAEMRPMLQAMQSGEMSVSRGVELLDMWLAGNYSDDQLPPVRNELGEGEMPWDRIDVLTKKCALYEQALKASWPAGASGKAFEYWNAARAAK